MQYTVDYFIKKFEAIPEEKWRAGELCDVDGKKCALGFCGGYETTESLALGGIIKKLYEQRGYRIPVYSRGTEYSEIVYNVNDGITPFRDESEIKTPKQRILAALYDIKKMQSPEPKVKEIIRYVAVPETIKELETVLN